MAWENSSVAVAAAVAAVAAVAVATAVVTAAAAAVDEKIAQVFAPGFALFIGCRAHPALERAQLPAVCCP